MKKFITIAVLVAWASSAQAISFSLTEGEAIYSPLTVSGNTEATEGWYPFEGQVGTMALFGNTGAILGEAPMTVDGDWMTDEPLDFFATLEYETELTSGFVRFTSEAVGDFEEALVVDIPIVFTTPPAAENESELPTELAGIEAQSGMSEGGSSEQKSKEDKSWFSCFVSWIKNLFN